jgi:hypothetical protein
MFSYDSLETLDIELTTACNAACPQCARYQPILNFNPEQDHHEIRLADFKRYFDEELLRHLKKLQFCGNFGDPAAAKDLFKIIKHARKNNPNISIGLNTNGGLRSSAWWGELAGLLTLETDYVVFSIDGLEDTNHIYRKNVNWHKLMSNATSFIDANGNAHWDMLVFDHNRHQVSKCKDIATSLGFKIFRHKESPRHLNPMFQGDNGKFIPLLKVDDPKINCFAVNDRSVYVSASGLCVPCCLLGDTVYLDRNSVSVSHPDILIKEQIDLNLNDIRDVIPKLNDVVDTWRTDRPVDYCALACNQRNLVKDMFKEDVEL